MSAEVIKGTQNFDLKSLNDVGVYEVPIIESTSANLTGFGYIVEDFEKADVEIVQWPQQGRRPVLAGTGQGGGITGGNFEMFWDGEILRTQNHAVNGQYITGWSTDPILASPSKSRSQIEFLYTFEANYHPDGGQVFYPSNGAPFIALLAPVGDDVKKEDFIAFYFDGSKGLHINAGVWHQPLFPTEDAQVFLDKQGAVHACVAINFVEEFGVYFKVPLKL
jgi:ureidoglycolate lyase